MSDTANTFTLLKPDMKEAYSDKNKRFQKIQAKLKEKHKKEDSKKCKCTDRKKCQCEY